MRVVVSHFFNEAYLLPWWLRHHRDIFDHGVLIDRYSTDGSADICRELVPSWEVVRSETAQFEAIKCDFEVMKHDALSRCLEDRAQHHRISRRPQAFGGRGIRENQPPDGCPPARCSRGGHRTGSCA